MKILYKPFGVIMGIIAGLFSKKIFNFIWGRFDDEEPPKPTTLQTSWPKILGAAAVQGMVFKTTRAVVDRQGAKGFAYLTGSWPGDIKPDPKGVDITKK